MKYTLITPIKICATLFTVSMISACGSSSNKGSPGSSLASSSSSVAALSSSAASNSSVMSDAASSSVANSSVANSSVVSSTINSSVASSASVAAATFTITERSPKDGANRVLIHSAITVKLGKAIMAESIKPEATLIVKEQDSGKVIAGQTVLQGEDVLVFTPAAALTKLTAYTVTLSNDLMSAEGDTLVGESWQFTSLFELGDTPQDVVNQCGTLEDLVLVHRLAFERRLIEGDSTCATLGYTKKLDTLILDCDVQAATQEAADLYIQAVKGRVTSGGASAGVSISVPKNFIEGGGIVTFGDFHTDTARLSRNNIMPVSYGSINRAYLNKYADLNDYLKNMTQEQCDLIMDERFTHMGASFIQVARPDDAATDIRHVVNFLFVELDENTRNN